MIEGWVWVKREGAIISFHDNEVTVKCRLYAK